MNRRFVKRLASGEDSQDDAELFFAELVGEGFGGSGEAVSDRDRSRADLFFAELMGEPLGRRPPYRGRGEATAAVEQMEAGEYPHSAHEQ